MHDTSHGPVYTPTVLPYTKSKNDVRGETWEIARLAHIHTEDGLCFKDRYGTCTAPKFHDSKTPASKRPLLRTKRARGYVALVMVWAVFMLVFGTLQWLTGGGLWGYFIWTLMALIIALLSIAVPRVMTWIDRGEDHAKR